MWFPDNSVRLLKQGYVCIRRLVQTSPNDKKHKANSIEAKNHLAKAGWRDEVNSSQCIVCKLQETPSQRNALYK